LYPWHPWSGSRVGIHKAVERSGGVVFRCDLKASALDRWLEIPAWVFDRAACARIRLEVEPRTNLAALQQLIEMCRVVDTVLVDQEMVYPNSAAPRSSASTTSLPR